MVCKDYISGPIQIIKINNIEFRRNRIPVLILQITVVCNLREVVKFEIIDK